MLLKIERIDNNGNYCKDNCKWATLQEQNRNKSFNISYKGKSLYEWCNLLGIKYCTARDRIKNRGKTIEEILGF